MFCGVDATGRGPLLQPPSVGEAGGVLHTIEAQFERAITAREKVKSRLIGDLDPRDWELPPKPKWMRWYTYERLAEKYRLQERIIHQCMADFLR